MFNGPCLNFVRYTCLLQEIIKLPKCLEPKKEMANMSQDYVMASIDPHLQVN